MAMILTYRHDIMQPVLLIQTGGIIICTQVVTVVNAKIVGTIVILVIITVAIVIAETVITTLITRVGREALSVRLALPVKSTEWGISK